MVCGQWCARDERGSNVGSSMVGRIVKYSAKFMRFSRYSRIDNGESMLRDLRGAYEEAVNDARRAHIRTVALTRTYTHSLTKHRFSERTVRAYTRARVESHLKSRDGTAESLVRQRVTGTLHPRNYRRVSRSLEIFSSNLLLHLVILKERSEENYAFYRRSRRKLMPARSFTPADRADLFCTWSSHFERLASGKRVKRTSRSTKMMMMMRMMRMTMHVTQCEKDGNDIGAEIHARLLTGDFNLSTSLSDFFYLLGCSETYALLRIVFWDGDPRAARSSGRDSAAGQHAASARRVLLARSPLDLSISTEPYPGTVHVARDDDGDKVGVLETMMRSNPIGQTRLGRLVVATRDYPRLATERGSLSRLDVSRSWTCCFSAFACNYVVTVPAAVVIVVILIVVILRRELYTL